MSPMPMVSHERYACTIPESLAGIDQLNHQLSAPPPPSVPPQRRNNQKKPTTFINKLFLFALSCLCIYSIAICSSEESFQRPLCRSLSTYRQYVVEPYIIPPLQAALNHPSVSPYVQQARAAEQHVEPYVVKAIEVSQPVIRKAVTIATPYAISAKRLAWDKTLVPQYYRHAVPRYNAYVQPHLDEYVVPVQQVIAHYLAIAMRYYDQSHSFYVARLQPHVSKAVEYGQRAYIYAKPRVLLAYAHVYTRLNARWQLIKPDVMRFCALYWERLAMIAELFGDLRREFVDPHVLRIWDKVVELSGGKTTPSETASANTAEPITEATTVEPTPETPVKSVPTSEAKTTPTASTASVVAESSSSVPPPPVETILETASSEVVSHVTSSTIAEPAAESTATKFCLPPSEAPVAPSADAVDEEDVDLFLQDLLGTAPPSEATALASDAEAAEAAAAEAAELKRIKAERTAEKRKDITARHVQWTTDLNQLIASSTEELRKTLAGIRQGAAHDLRKGSGSPDGPKEAVDAAQAEGERLLKGLDSYLKKAAKAPENNNKEKWAQVLDVVEAKFAEAMGKLQENVSTWYDEVREREAQEVLDSAAKVKALAERAQADIGVDYAWLDDVTYSDWQRYHDLMRAYEKYDSDARTIANGTHPLSPEDPLVEAMSNTQDDAMTIIEGFQVRIRDLKALARDIYSEVDAADVSALPVANPSETPAQVAPPPEMSILPIDPAQPEAGVEGLDKILVGRSAEEVKEAVARAESFGASVLEKGSSVVAEAVPTVTPDHAEL
ncbi:hypothetical protein HDZ31DRAFT_84358 [Schizophyllum fasciatum]